jgi:glutamate-ammonia-ligase adenylyltransferase
VSATPLDAALDALQRGAPSTPALAALGDPEPERSAEALARAACAPDLAPARAEWLPELLLSARPGFGASALVDLAARYLQTCGRPLDLRAHPSLVRVLGSSDFLARLLLRHPNWVEELAGEPPAPPRTEPIEADWTAMRVAKYRGLLRIAARDLAGRPFEQSARELSDLADGILDAALRAASRVAPGEPPALLALGKLGGRELNFSSDVDLLFVYAEDGDDPLERHHAIARLIRELKRQLESASDDGFGYRVDLDLRPEGTTGVLANPVDAALRYYETFGAEWERQALVRLRAISGPARVANEFLEGTASFVYRRLIDPSAIRRVRAMKMRIEDERRRAGHDLEQDLKEGPGGIRDVEFLVQALQLFWGGRHPELRTGNVLEALAALRRARLLPEDVVAGLGDAYRWLRRAEHALQMVEERQTARFPRDARAQTALARRLRYRDPDGARARDRLLDDWTNERAFVRSQFDALVLETGPDDAA